MGMLAPLAVVALVALPHAAPAQPTARTSTAHTGRGMSHHAMVQQQKAMEA